MGQLRNTRIHRAYWVCAALIAITIFAFWPVLSGEFIGLDDGDYVTNNTQVQAGLTTPSVAWAFTTFACGNWHPLTWIAHMLDCQLYGLNPAGHHLTNLLLHLANVLLLFMILCKLTGAVWKSAIVAVLFAIHPLHVESVAWVAERKDVLSTFFWMLTVWAYIAYVGRGGIARYLLVMVLFALGLLAKPMLVSLPIVLLILDYWPLNRVCDAAKQTSWRRLALEKAPLVVLAAASCIVTYHAQTDGPLQVGRLSYVALPLRIDNALVSYATYLVKMLWPADLTVLYPHPLRSLPIWQVVGSGLLFALLSAVAFSARKRRPCVLAGWMWYVITLVPVIGLVQVGDQAMADRYTYIPLIGIFLVIVWSIYDWLAERAASGLSRAAALAVCGALIALLVVCTRVQAGYWVNINALFGHAIQVTRNNYVAQLVLAIDLDRRGDLAAAKEHCEEALRLRPNWPDALLNYGILKVKSGDPDAAISLYRRTVRIQPTLIEAHYNLAVLYDSKKQTDAAIREYETTLKLAPNHASARNNLAVAFFATGRYTQAWEQVHAAQAAGFSPHPGFLQALSAKMPEPE